MQRMSGLHKDIVASHLRHQLRVLQSVLDNVEHVDMLEDGYINESLRYVVANLHKIIKLCHEQR